LGSEADAEVEEKQQSERGSRIEPASEATKLI
jgi:hypothetical protein